MLSHFEEELLRRVEEEANSFVNENIINPTDSDYIYAQIAIKKGIIIHSEWQLELERRRLHEISGSHGHE